MSSPEYWGAAMAVRAKRQMRRMRIGNSISGGKGSAIIETQSLMDHEKWLEQHDRMIADHDREMAELRASQAKTENALRRAIRLSVQDARRQRKWNLEFKERMNELTAAVKAFLDRGGNGRH